jgi:hypothetical protein
MKNYLKKIILAGISGAVLVPALHATNLSLVTVGGNASIKLVEDRLTNSVGGLLPGGSITFNPTNSLIFEATGAWNGGSTNVTWDFNFTGGAAAIQDIASQNYVQLKNTNSGAGPVSSIPVSAISIVAPETVGISSVSLGIHQDYTLVAPLVYVKNNGSDLVGVSNITQRLANYLESSGGTLPATYFGGATATNVYFVGRNSSAAVRQVFDANIFFTGAADNFHTNSLGQPDDTGYDGAGSGSEVAQNVAAIPGAIGTLAVQDAGSLTKLSYEGVPYSTNTVINGTYPIWGYERYIYFPSPDSRAPSADQLKLIQALEKAVSNPGYDYTNSLFQNKFVSYADVNASVKRSKTLDGGLITSQLY